MRESIVEKAICDYAKSRGFLTYKFVSPGHKGVPDRMFISRNGKVLFMEVKAPGETPTPLQLREIRKMRERGVNAVWCDETELGKGWLDTMNK